MNSDESERALERGLKELNVHKNYAKALKFFTISHRLIPSPDKQQLIIQCNEALTQAQGTPISHSRTSSTAPNPSNSTTENFTAKLHTIYKSIKNYLLQYEQKYIAESYKHMIRAVIVLIVGVIICKFILKQNVRLGSLPGDINYSSQGMQVFFPMTTCALLSYISPIIFNWYNTIRQ